MNFFSTLKRPFRYFEKKKKENLLIGLLLCSSGIIAGSYGINHFLNTVPHDGITLTSFNTLIADTTFSLLLMAPSFILLAIGYILWEAHSLGWKLAAASSVGTILLTATGILRELGFGLIIAGLCGLASILEIRRRRTFDRSKDSPAITENLAKFGVSLSGVICIFILVGMFAYIAIRASPYLSLDFFFNTQWGWVNAAKVLAGAAPGSMGGVLGFTVGSLSLVAVCELIAFPLGLGAAIYLSEYASQNKLTDTVRFFVETLAGVPSVVIGLVGYAVFVLGELHWGNSLLGGGLSLAFMILPWNIRIAEEAIRAVPATYREAAYALGATPWQTTKRAVLFAASPGIITGVLLGVGAALGETIVVAMTSGEVDVGPQILPSNMLAFGTSIPSLPVFIWRAPLLLAIGAGSSGATSNIVFKMYSVALAGAFVLIVLYLAICAAALLVRNYLTKRIKGC